MESIIRLFRGLPVENKTKKIDKELLVKTIPLGFVFAPEVVANYKNYQELISIVEKIIGISAEKANNSFHKSWVKIKESSIEQLVMEQIVHYFTTYGFEEMGIYDENSVYIPAEKLELPSLKVDDLNFTVIRGYTKDELKAKLLKLLGMGVALGEDTISDVMDIATFVGLQEGDLELIKNKEVKIALYEYFDLVPENPIEFLRFLVYKASEKTLLIKNEDLVEAIKSGKNIGLVKLFKDYDKKYDLAGLASIFYRFKPIFLAFRTSKDLKRIVNKIRRLAVKNHKPMLKDYLNDITALIKKGEEINASELEEELAVANIFRKIRLAYALRFRSKAADSIIYKIRNGKGYATEFDFPKKNYAKKVLDIVLGSIIGDISKVVKGKKIYIPSDIIYALPTTEKQFTGNFPSGTYINVPKDMIVGVHWDNVGEHRIDLDLSSISTDEKIGWDSGYRTEGNDILFSGDMTDAQKPNGATELIYVKRQVKKSLIMILNYYNQEEGVEVPFKIVVAKEQTNDFKQNYMVNPNNILAVATSSIKQKQKVLGLLITTLAGSRFYFAENYLGRSITSSGNDFVDNARKYLVNFFKDMISLNEILAAAGAKLVDKKGKDVIDLSPEVLQKDTILNLITNNKTMPKGQ